MTKRVILCVDDEKIVLDSLKSQLKQHFGSSFIYEFAENANDALELIDELDEEGFVIIIIVSDWLMPGINGDEFLIQVHEKYPEVITVLLTGQADDEAIEKTIKHANLHRCLYKPWSEKDLIETIQSGLKKL